MVKKMLAFRHKKILEEKLNEIKLNE